MMLAAACAAMVAGCAGYDPPMAGDHYAGSYQVNLEKCRKQAQDRADKIANATPQSAIKALFASNEPYRQDVIACMKGRGYARQPS